MLEHDVKTNLHRVWSTLPDEVRLVAVSKFHDNKHIEAAYAEGQRIFGESRVQELSVKHETLPQDIEWHFIGHLQTNKVKYIAPYISLIHSVDSLTLLKEINRHAALNNRIINVLLELHVAKEESKYGFSVDACRKMLNDGEWRALTNVQICGLMTMASFVDDTEQIRNEFMIASDFFKEVKDTYFANDNAFCERSWGMSDDYPIAIECGSTLVRIGTTLFGPRQY